MCLAPDHVNILRSPGSSGDKYASRRRANVHAPSLRSSVCRRARPPPRAAGCRLSARAGGDLAEERTRRGCGEAVKTCGSSVLRVVRQGRPCLDGVRITVGGRGSLNADVRPADRVGRSGACQASRMGRGGRPAGSRGSWSCGGRLPCSRLEVVRGPHRESARALARAPAAEPLQQGHGADRHRYATNPQVVIDADSRPVVSVGRPVPGNRRRQPDGSRFSRVASPTALHARGFAMSSWSLAVMEGDRHVGAPPYVADDMQLRSLSALGSPPPEGRVTSAASRSRTRPGNTRPAARATGLRPGRS